MLVTSWYLWFEAGDTFWVKMAVIKLSPTHYVPNIRHQHRCNHIFLNSVQWEHNVWTQVDIDKIKASLYKGFILRYIIYHIYYRVKYKSFNIEHRPLSAVHYSIGDSIVFFGSFSELYSLVHEFKDLDSSWARWSEISEDVLGWGPTKASSVPFRYEIIGTKPVNNEWRVIVATTFHFVLMVFRFVYMTVFEMEKFWFGCMINVQIFVL